MRLVVGVPHGSGRLEVNVEGPELVLVWIVEFLTSFTATRLDCFSGVALGRGKLTQDLSGNIEWLDH